jgi:protein TonB
MKKNEVLFDKQWIDLVFENRNQQYGAYELRQSYERNMAIGLLAMMSLVLSVAFFSKIKLQFFTKPTPIEHHVVCTFPVLSIPELTPQIPASIQAQAAPAPAAFDDRLREMRFTQTSIETTTEIPTTLPTDVQPLEYSNNPAGSGAGTGGEIETNTNVVNPVLDITPPTISDIVEVMPVFPGGEASLYSFISRHIQYPERERELGIEGKAIISFVVSPEGEITQIKTLRADSKGFSRESERVIGLLPNFIPGQQGGRKVHVRLAIPICFKTAN